MPSAIKVVLLDVGGVLVDLDGMPSLAALLKSGESPETLHQRWTASPAVIAHETGKLSAAEFAERLVGELRLPVSSAAFLDAFRLWPRCLQPGALDLLDRIQPAYAIAALSNTSAVHWERVVAFGLAHRFQRTYLSFETGHLKPAHAAFHGALVDLGVKPSEVMFFDDSATNVRVSRGLGIEAHLASGPFDVDSKLRDFGIL